MICPDVARYLATARPVSAHLASTAAERAALRRVAAWGLSGYVIRGDRVDEEMTPLYRKGWLDRGVLLLPDKADGYRTAFYLSERGEEVLACHADEQKGEERP